MPQFGEGNIPASFPSWVQGGLPGILARHPHPGTPRIDGRLRWPSDANHIALHGRAWGRLFWQETQPPSNNGEYDNYETVYWDWWATAASEATGWTSKTTSGRSALLRLRHLDVLPQAGVPGSELYVEYFKDEVSLGIRRIEIPNDPTGLQWDSVIAPGTVPPVNTFPPYDLALSPGQWVSLQVIPAPECYRHFDTHRTCQSGNELDPGGMAAIKVRIHRFGWGQNEFQPGGGYTKVQQSFARAIQSDWIVRPVFHAVSGWIASHLEYKSTFFWDPVASDFPGKFGLYYGFAIRVIFNTNLFLWTLHIRTWRADDVDPSWDIPVSQSLDSGLSFLFGISGALFASNFPAAAPFESRNMEQYDISNEIWPRFGPLGPFGLLPFDPIFVTLLSTTPTERGTELPSAGNLDMPRRTADTLVFKPAATQSILGNPRMIFEDAQYNSAGFWQPLISTNSLVVPAGITRVEGAACFDASASNATTAITIDIEGSTKPGNSILQISHRQGTERRGTIILAPTDVVEGDEIFVKVNSSQGNLSGNQRRNWLYLKALFPNTEPISTIPIAYDAPIPAPVSEFFVFRIPPSLDGYEIANVSASLGVARSTSGNVQLALFWIRQVGRMIEDITDDPITIEANQWTSETASNPPTLFGSAITAQVGDILMASIASQGTNAKGLIINFDMTE